MHVKCLNCDDHSVAERLSVGLFPTINRARQGDSSKSPESRRRTPGAWVNIEKGETGAARLVDVGANDHRRQEVTNLEHADHKRPAEQN